MGIQLDVSRHWRCFIYSHRSYAFKSRLDISQWTRNKTPQKFRYFMFHIFNIVVDGKLTNPFYGKRGDFSLAIVILLYLSSNIQLSPANDLYVSQRIGYVRACSAYNNLCNRGRLLIKILMQLRLLNSGYLLHLVTWWTCGVSRCSCMS